MSASETQSIDMHSANRPKSGVPWWTLITAVGLAAAAVILVRRLAAETEVVNLDEAFEQCDRAATTLEERIAGNGVALAS
jgi:hypothetical protein